MAQPATRPSLSTRYQVDSRRWPGAWWILGWDQEQRTFYAQLYGTAPVFLRPVYPEWLYAGSPTESGVEYDPHFPALTIGDDEGETATVDDLVTAMAEILPTPIREQLERDQARGEAELDL